MSPPAAPGEPRAVAVIPARHGSTRLPGKPLLEAAGRTLIEHVWRAVRRAESLQRVIVATDDRRIADAVSGFGGEARITRSDHATGTDRIAELLPELGAADVVVNVQGDEPDVDASALDRLVGRLAQDASLGAATLAAPYPADADPSDPDRVKVVVDRNGRAVYFSRAAVPGGRRYPEGPERLLHVGVYAYRRDVLARFAGSPETRLEAAEGLEQLRLLEIGTAIGVVMLSAAHGGIDTEADFAAFRRRLEARGAGVRRTGG